MKDLGPDFLNFVPEPTNYDPWEKDGPVFPAFDGKLVPVKSAKDYLINSKVFLHSGNSHDSARGSPPET